MEEIEVLEVEVVIDAVVIVTGNAVAEAPWPASVCVGKLCRSNKRNYVSKYGRDMRGGYEQQASCSRA